MNLGAKALQVLKTVAPLLGTAVGGPFGTIAGVAISAALGTSSDKDTEAALLAATPDQLVALKKAEQEFTARMRELDISEEKLYFDDVSSARDRESAVKDRTPQILAYGTTAGFFSILLWMLFNGAPKESDVLMVMLGALGTAWTSIVNYYFGSSIGARRNGDALAQIAKQP
jgi:hypothetical protein